MSAQTGGSPVQGSLKLFWGVLLGVLIPTWCLVVFVPVSFGVFIIVSFAVALGLVWYMIVAPVRRVIREEEEAEERKRVEEARQPTVGRDAVRQRSR